MSWECLHCKKRPGNRSRGLCQVCYYTPDVRAAYPPAYRPAVSSREADFKGPAPGPDAPTDAPAGTEAKLRVLAERAARRQSLFHDGDSLRRVG